LADIDIDIDIDLLLKKEDIKEAKKQEEVVTAY